MLLSVINLALNCRTYFGNTLQTVVYRVCHLYIHLIFCIYFEYLKYPQYFLFHLFLSLHFYSVSNSLVSCTCGFTCFSICLSLSLFWLSFVYWGGPGAPAIVVVGFFFDSQVAWDDRDLPWNYLLLFTYLLPLSKAPSLFLLLGPPMHKHHAWCR